MLNFGFGLPGLPGFTSAIGAAAARLFGLRFSDARNSSYFPLIF